MTQQDVQKQIDTMDRQLHLAQQKVDIMERWLRSIGEFIADQQQERTLPDPLVVIEAMVRAAVKAKE